MRGGMILLIEDDPIAGELLSQIVRRLRLPSRLAGTIAEAREQLRAVPVGVVVVDIELPDGSGLELIEEMRTLPWLRDVPVLFCTGEATADIVQRVRALGVVDFVIKTIAPDLITARITRALERTPTRVPSLRDVMVSKRTTANAYVQMRDRVRDSLNAIAQIIDDDASELKVAALVSAAVLSCNDLGALRTANILRELEPGRADYQAARLHDAALVEAAAYEPDAEISEPRVPRLSAAATAP